MLPGWTRAAVAGKPADVFDPPGTPTPRFGVLFLHPVGGESPSDNTAYTAAFARHRLAVCAPWGGESWWADRVCPGFDPHVTAERHLLDTVLPWMRTRWKLGPRAVAAAGISMGGQGAVRLGFKHPHVFGVVASVAGAFDYHDRHGHIPSAECGTRNAESTRETGEAGFDSAFRTPHSALEEMYRTREACRQDTAILWVDPANAPPHVWFASDPADAEWHRGNDRLHEKLSATGVAHVADLSTTRGGHTWAYFDAMAEPMAAWLAAALAKDERRLV